MKLKKQIGALTEVEEKFRGLYRKEGDGYVLEVELDAEAPAAKGDDPKLAEFRNNNIALTKKVQEMEAALKKYEGIDPEQARQAAEALGKLKENEERELIKAGKFEEVIERRTKAMRDEMAKQVGALSTARDEAVTKGATAIKELNSIRTRDLLTKALSKAGTLRKGAEVDALLRGERVFRLDQDGRTLVPDASGTVLFGKKGEPLTHEEWAASLVEEAPFLWETTGGGGAGGGRAPATGPGGKRILRNPTPQEMGQHLDGISDGSVVVVRD